MENRRIIGLILAVVGIVLVLNSFGIINIPTSTLSVAPTGTVGVQVTSNFRLWNFLSTITAGNTFKWSVTVKNTGSLPWDTGWVKVRLGVNGAQVVDVTCQSNPSSCPSDTVIGSFKVEKCQYGTDVESCREDIVNTWGFKYSTDGSNWLSCPDYLQKVCSIDVGVVNPGESRTFYFKMTVPSGITSGNFPLITQAFAWNGATYAVAGTYDPLKVGTMQGEISLAMVGAILTLLGGLLLYIK
ncbi:MAG: hypothetical protein ACTSWZ_07790 [Candidatus Heimdallarchaeaceae archaeon]